MQVTNKHFWDSKWSTEIFVNHFTSAIFCFVMQENAVVREFIGNSIIKKVHLNKLKANLILYLRNPVLHTDDIFQVLGEYHHLALSVKSLVPY